MSEIQELRDDVLELDRQIRRLRAQQQQRGAGDFGRANAIVGVIPSANIPAHGSIGLWTNQSGGALGIGAVVIQSGDRQFNTTVTADDLDVMGVLTEAVANTADGRLRHQGYHPSVIVEGAVVAGQFLRTSTTAGAAEDAGTTPTAGTFGMALTAAAGPGAGTVAAYLFSIIGTSAALDADFYNGTFVETLDADVSEAAGVVTLSLQQEGGGDLTMRFSDGLTILDCTPAVTIALTVGGDATPQANYIYIPIATKVLTKSTTQWPVTEHIKVGYYLVPSAAFVAAGGGARCYIQQQWNDHRMGTDNMGHMAHMAQRERLTAARYFSGIDPNGTTSYLTIVGATVDYKATAGVIWQMHEHASPAVDTSGGDEVLVVNWPGVEGVYHNITNLFDIVEDSGGNTIGNNKWFNLVIWGVANKSGTYEPAMINLPAGFYNTQASAEQDISGFDNFNLPREFDLESSTAFLIARLTIRKQAGTWTFGSVVDLRRGDLLGARGGASSSETEFPDNTFNIFDATDNTKVFDFQADQITPGNTRTLTVPDGDGTLILATGLAGGQTLIGGTVAGEDLTLQSTAHAARGDILIPDGSVIIGVDDTTAGVLSLFGDGANAGGSILLYMGAAQDTTYDDWTFGVKVSTDDLEWRVDAIERMVLSAPGQLQVPTVGAGAGILIGGDTQLYRSAANVLAIPDTITLLGGVGMKLRLFDSGAVQYGLGIQANVMEFISDDATADFRWGYGASGALTERMFLDSGTGQLQVPVTGSGAGLLLGGDAQLYRGAANEIYVAASDWLRLATDGSGGGLKFGSVGDVELYRSALNTLYTPDDFTVDGVLLATAIDESTLTAGVVAGGVLHEGYRTLMQESAPNAYWRLGEPSGDFADVSGNAHTGTAVGMITYSATGALALDPNDAITLDGATEYFTATDHADFDLTDGPYTLEAWINKAVDGTIMTIFSKGAGAYELRMTAGNALMLVREGVLAICTSTTTITGAGWHHVAATKNGAAVVLYIDGVDVTGVITDSTMVDTITDLNVGRFSTGIQYWNGSLDEVAVYPSVLSAATILAHYNRGVEGGRLTMGDLDHDGSLIGFFGTTPVAQAAAYTPTNVTPTRSFDANATSIDELADVVGTMIADNQAYGLLQ